MRNLILAASVAAFASPAAFAQSSPTFPHEMDREIVQSLPSPAEVEDMAEVAGHAAEAILDVPVGGIIRAVDPTRRVHRDETLGEMAGRDDPYIRERLRDSVQGMAGSMTDIMAQVAIVAPELRRALAGVEQSLERSMGRVRDRDYDRRYDRDYDYRR